MPTHAEKRTVPYTPEQMFDLVADVEQYPSFLPWCVACRIRRREGPDSFIADLVIGFKVFRERFTSRVGLDRPRRVDVIYHEGPFRHLTNHWTFTADERGHCVIDFYIDFEFRSRTLQKLIGKLFNEAVQRMVNAFERRARALYGAPRLDPRRSAPLSAVDVVSGKPLDQ
ncbi:MAG: type II toxin-antitoxin system RatA family toxin [Rhodospirillales bacterium]